MEFETVTVTVPTDRIADLLAYAAELARSSASDRDRSPGTHALSPAAIRDAYLGGESVRWRPFLEMLASRPGEWVGWLDLCKHIEFTPAQAAGMLGAAERRLKQKPPYERKQVGDKKYFRVTSEVAAIIREVSGR